MRESYEIPKNVVVYLVGAIVFGAAAVGCAFGIKATLGEHQTVGIIVSSVTGAMMLWVLVSLDRISVGWKALLWPLAFPMYAAKGFVTPASIIMHKMSDMDEVDDDTLAEEIQYFIDDTIFPASEEESFISMVLDWGIVILPFLKLVHYLAAYAISLTFAAAGLVIMFELFPIIMVILGIIVIVVALIIMILCLLVGFFSKRCWMMFLKV